jgi:hypothetical protein
LLFSWRISLTGFPARSQSARKFPHHSGQKRPAP